MLGEVLSRCCLMVTPWALAEVRGLLANRPDVMLPESWAELAAQAEAWVAAIGDRDPWRAATFPGLRQIGAALRDKPLAVPAWAAREREAEERATIFDDAEGRN
jgi:hypothetical protein